jgi:glycerol uptake facilitator-like aquaporin
MAIVEEDMPDIKKLLAELFGAYILLTIGGFAIVSTALGVDGSLVIPLGFGLGLLIGLYMFGEVSGGHYNPAVSVAALLDARIGVAHVRWVHCCSDHRFHSRWLHDCLDIR